VQFQQTQIAFHPEKTQLMKSRLSIITAVGVLPNDNQGP